MKTQKFVGKQSKLSAPEADIRILKEALFENGRGDKDVTQTISSAFLKYDRNDLDLQISFSTKLKPEELDWAFEMVRSNMEEIYDMSGYGWDDDDKLQELSEDGARFLLVRERKSNELVGFAHFRFTVQGDVMEVMAGEPSLHLWDIHIEESIQRQGLGKHLLTILELIARQQKMRMISIPIQLNDEVALAWVSKARGYAPDGSLKELVGFDSEMEGFEVFAKTLSSPAAKIATAAALPSTPVKKQAAGIPTSEILSPTSITFAAIGEDVSDASPPPQPPQPPQAPVGECDTVDSDGYVVVSSAAAFSSEAEGISIGTGDVADSDDAPSITLGDAISRLTALFIDRNGREPTSEEVESWEVAMVESEDAASAACDA